MGAGSAAVTAGPGSSLQSLWLWLGLAVLTGAVTGNIGYTYWLSGRLSSLELSYQIRAGPLQSPSPAPGEGKVHGVRGKRGYSFFEGTSIPAVEFYPTPKPQGERAKEDKPQSVWLTAYSKIPLSVLQEFCNATKEYCPAGDPGPPGIPGATGDTGQKGDRGDRGMPGEKGPVGPPGRAGLDGPMGLKGDRGATGLDGREGLPGYPGLDGVPGRDAKDGVPGKDGIPGIPGTPGRSGQNGTDGIPGMLGPKGPIGLTGPPGLPGPRGRKGVPGNSGKPGAPGVGTWKVNGTKDDKALVPPEIGGEGKQVIQVQEGDNVRLKCSAAGHPEPIISWKREDNKPITQGNAYENMVPGDKLLFSRVGREQMGSYVCTAWNGIPNQAQKVIKLEVTFAPLIRIRNQMVGTSNGSSAVLECHVEAFPQSVNYWMYGDLRQLEQSWKYDMKQEEEDHFRTHMILNITYIEPSDYGLYKCVSKNEKGRTLGVFTVFEMDPNLPSRTNLPESAYTVYGERPEPAAVEPDCPVCQDCPAQKACPSGKQEGLNVKSVTGFTHAKWKPIFRERDCMISQVGKPVFYGYKKTNYGAWMQDAQPPGGLYESKNNTKFWLTLENEPDKLYEYLNRTYFKNDNHTKVYTLPYSFAGNSQVVYNGSFYFHRNGTKEVVRYDLANNHTSALVLQDLAYHEDFRLYRTQHNYVDLAADENGLWAIFSSNTSITNTVNTVIVKFHPSTMEPEYMWNITLDHHNVGEMFVTCGVLYAVQSTLDSTTHIMIAFDLYNHKPVEVKLDFTNPFRQNTMISYNPAQEVIATWDQGNQLIYPIKVGTIDLGQPDPPGSDDDDTDT